MKVKFKGEMSTLKKQFTQIDLDRAIVTSKLKILKKPVDETKNEITDEKSFSGADQTKRSSYGPKSLKTKNTVSKTNL